MAASRLDVDEEALIVAVQDRPCIWDSRAVCYADRGQKSKAWDEIVQAVYPEWTTLSATQQTVKRKNVQTRWRSLKDCYTRELRQIRLDGRSGSSPSKRKTYLYFDNLEFLRPVLESRSTSGNLERSSGPEPEQDSSDAPPTEATSEVQPGQSNEPSLASLQRGRRRRGNDSSIPLTGQLTSLLDERRGLMDDPNYHFAMFSYTILKKLPRDKMDLCRKELWDTLNKYVGFLDPSQAPETLPCPPPPMPQSQYQNPPTQQYYPVQPNTFPQNYPVQNTHSTQYSGQSSDYNPIAQPTYLSNVNQNPYPTQYPSYQTTYSSQYPPSMAHNPSMLPPNFPTPLAQTSSTIHHTLQNTMMAPSSSMPQPSSHQFRPQTHSERNPPNILKQTAATATLEWIHESTVQTRPSSSHSTAAGSHSSTSLGTSRTPSARNTPEPDLAQFSD